jgi:hypothetical protein
MTNSSVHLVMQTVPEWLTRSSRSFSTLLSPLDSPPLISPPSISNSTPITADTGPAAPRSLSYRQVPPMTGSLWQLPIKFVVGVDWMWSGHSKVNATSSSPHRGLFAFVNSQRLTDLSWAIPHIPQGYGLPSWSICPRISSLTHEVKATDVSPNLAKTLTE